MIAADTYVPVDETLIPTGTLDPVEGTPMDLRTAVAVGAHIDDPFDQLVRGKGYDHNWVLNNNCDINVLAANAVSAKSGIGLEVYTNEPGIQFYAGNAMTKDGDKGKLGVIYPHRGACVSKHNIIPILPTSRASQVWCCVRAKSISASVYINSRLKSRIRIIFRETFR